MSGRVVAAPALIALVLCPGIASSQSKARNILDRTTEYIVSFVHGFSNVVAEEHYIQTANPSNPGAGRPRRELVSDFLLVKGLDDASWYQFRDVRVVDGKPVVDRDRRLSDLFLQPWDAALKQAIKIGSDSARYNLVNVGTINFPLTAIALLQPSYRDRFELSAGGLQRIDGRDLRTISFREMSRNDSVLGAPASGRVWVEDATGRIMKTELQLRPARQRFAYTITTSFAFDERLQLAVPVTMHDSYPGYLDMTGLAIYGGFRSFQVRTGETLR